MHSSRPRPIHYVALLLSFSGCTCQWQAGTSRSWSTSSSGGDQVIVVEDPDHDARQRAERDRRERGWGRREQSGTPRYASDPNKAVHVGAAPAQYPTSTVAPVGPVPAQPGVPAPAYGTPAAADAPAPGTSTVTSAVPSQPAVPAQPAQAAPAAPAAPPPTEGDNFVRARTPASRPGAGTEGAATVGAPAQNGPKRSTYGKQN